MLDSIVFSSNSFDIDSFNIDNVSNLRSWVPYDVVRYKGYLDNLTVKFTPSSIAIIGSLTKFYRGNNVESLSISDTKRAINKISDSLHLDISEFNVVAANFI